MIPLFEYGGGLGVLVNTVSLIPQIFHKIQEITKSVDLVRSDGTSYEDVRYGFGTPKGNSFSL